MNAKKIFGEQQACIYMKYNVISICDFQALDGILNKGIFLSFRETYICN